MSTWGMPYLASTRWRSQWAESRLLRLGVLVIAVMIWVQLLWLLGDAAGGWRQREQALQDDVDRVQALARERAWPQRADDARQQVEALRGLLWPESDRGVAEAAVQDWLRSTATKAGLALREVALVRSAAVAQATEAPRPGGVPQLVRLRVTAELNRMPLMAFLSELARHERAIVVERLVLRSTSVPPQAEFELRVALTPPSATGSTASGVAR